MPLASGLLKREEPRRGYVRKSIMHMARNPKIPPPPTVHRRARIAGLRYVNCHEPGFTRRRHGKGYVYYGVSGRRITSERTLRRIESLVIPPAWQDVWICRYANGHIQCTGIDDAQRKQYIYHPEWSEISNLTKFDRLHLMAALLPRIRRQVRAHLRTDPLTRQRVLATVVRILDKAHLRIGSPRYAQERGTAGATTLLPEHVELDDFRVSLEFPGKSGQWQEIQFADQKVAQTIRAREEIEGQFLFAYVDDAREVVDVDSTKVNAYLQQISGESLTAKDFRTWAGTVTALAELAELEPNMSQTAKRRSLVAAIDRAAEQLGNTRAICRSHYVHPGILAAFEADDLPRLVAQARRSRKRHHELNQDERLLANLLPHLPGTGL